MINLDIWYKDVRSYFRLYDFMTDQQCMDLTVYYTSRKPQRAYTPITKISHNQFKEDT